MVRVPRSRGGRSGVMLVLLGAGGALVPLIGAYFQFVDTAGLAAGEGGRTGDAAGAAQAGDRRAKSGLLSGFKDLLMQGEAVGVAVGLRVAVAFRVLINAFADNIISPLVNAAGGGGAAGQGLGW